MLRRKAILPLGYIVLLSSHPIFADDSYDNLTNSKGKTPCDLADEIEDCALSSRALASRFPNASSPLPRFHPYPRDSPDPSKCTCTNVYFNMYSACLSMHKNPTIAADDWRAHCQAANLQVTDQNFDEYDIPAWAHVDLPEGNHTFDIAAAFQTAAVKPSGWSNYQVIITVAVIVSVVGLFGVFVILWRWKRVWARKQDRTPSVRPPKPADGSMRLPNWSRRRVRVATRDTAWEIDREGESLDGEYEFVGGPNSGRARNGHIRLPSSPFPYASTASIPTHGPGFFLNVSNKLSHFARSIPLPWRPRTVKVQSRRPEHRHDFSIDDDEPPEAPRSTSTLAGYPMGTFSSSHEPVVRQPVSHGYVDVDSDSDSDYSRPAATPMHTDNERLGLMYPSQQNNTDVMLISGSGRNFTLESGTTPSEAHPSSTHLLPLVETRNTPRGSSPASRLSTSPTPPSPRQTSPRPPQPTHGRDPSDQWLAPSTSHSPRQRVRLIPAASAPNLSMDASTTQRPSQEQRNSSNLPHYPSSAYNMDVPAFSSPPYNPIPMENEQVLGMGAVSPRYTPRPLPSTPPRNARSTGNLRPG